MKARGKVISFLLILDTFLASYAFGFNSRSVPVIDPSMPRAVVAEKPARTAAGAAEANGAASHETSRPTSKGSDQARADDSHDSPAVKSRKRSRAVNASQKRKRHRKKKPS